MDFFNRKVALRQDAEERIFDSLAQKWGCSDGSYYEVEMNYHSEYEVWVSCHRVGGIMARKVSRDTGEIEVLNMLDTDELVYLADMMDNIDDRLTQHFNEGKPLVCEFCSLIRLVTD